MRAILLALIISFAACGPIEKTPRPLWKFTYYNQTNDTIKVRVAGLGDWNWPATQAQPSPPSLGVFVPANSEAFFYWKETPEQLFIDTFKTANVLALGRDYSFEDFILRVQ